MIKTSALGHPFWDFAAKYTATILLNTNKGDDGTNAWTVLTGRDAHISSIRMFGEFRYSQMPADIRKKASFDEAKAKLAGIIGHDDALNWWLIGFEGVGKFLVSRDVQSLTGRSLVPKEGPPPVQPWRRTELLHPSILPQTRRRSNHLLGFHLLIPMWNRNK